MKIKDGFILKNIAGSTVVVPVGENFVNLQLMLNLNESGTFLWKKLQNDCTKEELLQAMLAEYEVSESVAAADIDEFLNTLKENHILDEEQQ